MNRLENWFCASTIWRFFTERKLLPWIVSGYRLGDHVLEVGAGPGPGEAPVPGDELVEGRGVTRLVAGGELRVGRRPGWGCGPAATLGSGRRSGGGHDVPFSAME